MINELYQVTYRNLDSDEGVYKNRLVESLEEVLSLLKPLCCEPCCIDEDWNEQDSVKEQINTLMCSRCAMDYDFEYGVIYENNRI